MPEKGCLNSSVVNLKKITRRNTDGLKLSKLDPSPSTNPANDLEQGYYDIIREKYPISCSGKSFVDRSAGTQILIETS